MNYRRLSMSLLPLLFVLMLPSNVQAEYRYKNGDITHDGYITISDVTLLIDRIMMDNCYVYDDVNQDVVVNVADVTALIDYLFTGEWEWAYTGPEIPDSAEVFTVNGVTFAMMPVEGGEKCDLFDPDDGYSVVSLGDYYIGQTEVTAALWEAVMGSLPHVEGDQEVYYEPTPARPVEMLSWCDCQEFIARLNELTGREFHLPTVAQWFWARYGGKNGHGYDWSGSDDVNEVAWSCRNIPYRLWGEVIFPVGLKKPNELGLYDMNGNVNEYTYNFDHHEGDLLRDHSQDTYKVAEFLGGNTQGWPGHDNGWEAHDITIYTYQMPGYLVGFRLALQKE